METVFKDWHQIRIGLNCILPYQLPHSVDNFEILWDNINIISQYKLTIRAGFLGVFSMQPMSGSEYDMRACIKRPKGSFASKRPRPSQQNPLWGLLQVLNSCTNSRLSVPLSGRTYKSSIYRDTQLARLKTMRSRSLSRGLTTIATHLLRRQSTFSVGCNNGTHVAASAA